MNSGSQGKSDFGIQRADWTNDDALILSVCPTVVGFIAPNFPRVCRLRMCGRSNQILSKATIECLQGLFLWGSRTVREKNLQLLLQLG